MEKLTHAITVKVSDATARDIELLARAKGMEVSEYMRHLIDSDKSAQRAVFDALSQVFAVDAVAGKGNHGPHGLPAYG